MAGPVFINCPFDHQYQKKFRAIVFTPVYCGFEPRGALEVSDASQNRLDKIMKIMAECHYSIHDISRTQLSEGLPRFNMPFELGIFVGAKKFGGRKHSKKPASSWTRCRTDTKELFQTLLDRIFKLIITSLVKSSWLFATGCLNSSKTFCLEIFQSLQTTSASFVTFREFVTILALRRIACTTMIS
jgi:hypothetical protein